jgi:hypothetical protein
MGAGQQAAYFWAARSHGLGLRRAPRCRLAHAAASCSAPILAGAGEAVRAEMDVEAIDADVNARDQQLRGLASLIKSP